MAEGFSIYQGTETGEVKVESHSYHFGRQKERIMSVPITTDRKEIKIEGGWSLSGAVKRWGKAAEIIYRSDTIGDPKRFAELSTSVVANQAMTERILDEHGDWRRGYEITRRRLKGIDFTRASFMRKRTEDFQKAAEKIEEWWEEGAKSENRHEEGTMERMYEDLILRAPEEMRQPEATKMLRYEVVVLGFKTLARRKESGEIDVPNPSEMVGPLRYLGVDLPGDELYSKDITFIERAARMRVTPEPDGDETSDARRGRLIEEENKGRREIRERREEAKRRKLEAERRGEEARNRWVEEEQQRNRHATVVATRGAVTRDGGTGVLADEEMYELLGNMNRNQQGGEAQGVQGQGGQMEAAQVAVVADPLQREAVGAQDLDLENRIQRASESDIAPEQEAEIRTMSDDIGVRLQQAIDLVQAVEATTAQGDQGEVKSETGRASTKRVETEAALVVKALHKQLVVVLKLAEDQLKVINAQNLRMAKQMASVMDLLAVKTRAGVAVAG